MNYVFISKTDLHVFHFFLIKLREKGVDNFLHTNCHNNIITE